MLTMLLNEQTFLEQIMGTFLIEPFYQTQEKLYASSL